MHNNQVTKPVLSYALFLVRHAGKLKTSLDMGNSHLLFIFMYLSAFLPDIFQQFLRYEYSL